MDDRCFDCQYLEQCDLAGHMEFCDDCKHCETCTIYHISCQSMYDVERNNGFELRE